MIHYISIFSQKINDYLQGIHNKMPSSYYMQIQIVLIHLHYVS